MKIKDGEFWLMSPRLLREAGLQPWETMPTKDMSCPFDVREKDMHLWHNYYFYKQQLRAGFKGEYSRRQRSPEKTTQELERSLPKPCSFTSPPLMCVFCFLFTPSQFRDYPVFKEPSLGRILKEKLGLWQADHVVPFIIIVKGYQSSFWKAGFRKIKELRSSKI